MATNAHILDNAIARYHKRIIAEVEKRCYGYCEKICESAVAYREGLGHNYTGNLINSIAVCLYRDGSPIAAWLSQDLVKPSMYRKMTRGGGKNGTYFFKVDWDGARSKYTPEVDTDEMWGEGDAQKFFQSYRPSGHKKFDIVVAYTTEYADWVEREHHTTGIMQTYDFAEYCGVTFLQLPRAGGGGAMTFN